MTIKVVDSIMGSGKTTFAIELIQSDIEHNYVYITPYLDEVERIKKACTNRRFHAPQFYSVGGEKYTKFDSLHNLLANGKNIVSTHALFKQANTETKELVSSGNYILILDEVMDVVQQLEIKRSDLQMLFDYGLLYLDNNYIKWNEQHEKAKEYDGIFNELKQMSINNNLIYYKDTILIWTFPHDIFESFKEVYILTYLFDGQIQKYYYDMNNIEYQKYMIQHVDNKYTLANFSINAELEGIKKIKDLIHIYHGNLNDIGNDDFTLSKSWYANKKYMIQKLKNNTENYFKNKVKAKSEQLMWTTFKDHQNKVKGRGYAKGFLSCNIRASNDYRDRIYLAYTINRFVNPIIFGFFSDRNIKINQNMWSLSELIQWMWRSGIRDNKEVYLYIPSKRMRDLLEYWLKH